MSEAANQRCEDCYFHRAGLCALTLETPCPTFRLAQPRVTRPAAPAPARAAAARAAGPRHSAA